jgi:hypothetical protein
MPKHLIVRWLGIEDLGIEIGYDQAGFPHLVLG